MSTPWANAVAFPLSGYFARRVTAAMATASVIGVQACNLEVGGRADA
jgi:hypothetical protein